MAVEVLRAPGLMDAGPLGMPPAPQLPLYLADFSAPQAFQQPREPPRRPKEQRKRQGKRRGGAGGKRKRQASGSGAGQYPNAPSLKALQQNNAKGARRHFSHSKRQLCRDNASQRHQRWSGSRGVRLCLGAGKDEMPSAVTPRTVPHAPLNTTGFLMAQNGARLCCKHLVALDRSPEAGRSHLVLSLVSCVAT